MSYSLRRERYDPAAETPFPVSRSTLSASLTCMRCAVLKLRHGVDHVSTPPYSINNGIDTMLKREFDVCRAKGEPHPVMRKFGLEHVVPFQHPDIDAWRDTRRGVGYVHPETKLRIYGALDDVWVMPAGTLIVPDYKATAKMDEAGIDADWQIGYKRQVEIYQWILRRCGFTVSEFAYFVYVNGDVSKEIFTVKAKKRLIGQMEFRLSLHAYVGNDAWVEPAVLALHAALNTQGLPDGGKDCEHCAYMDAVEAVEREVEKDIAHRENVRC